MSSSPKKPEITAESAAVSADKTEPAPKSLKARRAKIEAAYAKLEAADARRARHSRYAPQFRAKLAIEGEK